MYYIHIQVMCLKFTIGCGQLEREECSIEERIGSYKEVIVRKACRSSS